MSTLDTSTLRRDVIAALDIGSSKTTCFIAQDDGDGMKILGIGTHRSRGVGNGVIVDMAEAEAAISSAVDTAEQMAGLHVNKVIVSLSGTHINAHRMSCDVSVAGHAIRKADIDQVLDTAAAKVLEQYDHQDTRYITLHTVPVHFCIDADSDVQNPIDMYGENLLVAVLLVNASLSALRNLETVTKRNHLEVEAFVAAPLASGLSCLTDEDRDLGVTLIDMGAETTSVAVFKSGHIIHLGVLPIGGYNVTKDIAYGLTTSLADAERLKTLYGNAIHAPSADKEMLEVPLIGDGNEGQTNQVSRSMLTHIIRPRLEETFELVRDHLGSHGVLNAAGRRVVLTGGASQLSGTSEVAAEVLQRDVGTSRPLALKNLADAVSGPGFSTCAGLLAYGMRHHPFDRGFKKTSQPISGPSAGKSHAKRPTSKLGRLGQWFLQNF